MTNLKSRVKEARQEALKQEEQTQKGLEEQFELEAIKFEKTFPNHAEEFEKLVYDQLVSKPYARINLIDVFNNGESIISRKMQRKLDLFIDLLLKKLGLVQIGQYKDNLDYSIVRIVALKKDQNKARRAFSSHERQAMYERFPELRYKNSNSWTETDWYVLMFIGFLILNIIVFVATH